MTPSDLDLPLLPSAEQIRRREFATIRRGYDPDQVRDYLLAVAEQIETLEKDLREKKMSSATRGSPSPGEALAEQVAREDAARAASDEETAAADPYERLTARFHEMIRRADEEASKVVEEATEEAGRIMGEARTEADRIRVDAQARAEEARQAGSEALAKAKQEADRTLGTLSERRETLVSQMQEMQTHLLSVAKGLEGAISEREAAIDAVMDMPALEAEGEAGEPEKAETSAKPGDEVLDPRYDDLWVSKDAAVDIPDLASIELDFDEDDRGD